MSDQVYTVYNSARPTTAQMVRQPTGTGIRTMLQIATKTTGGIEIVEWGMSFYGFTAVAPVEVELFGCTGAASGLTGVSALGDLGRSNPESTDEPNVQVGAALTGFAAAAPTEGTVAAYNLMDIQALPPTAPYVKQWPLGLYPQVPKSQFLRVRVNAPATVDCHIYVSFCNI